jgi:hypothetical protein
MIDCYFISDRDEGRWWGDIFNLYVVLIVYNIYYFFIKIYVCDEN